MPLNYWTSTPKKLPSRTLREFRGVNKLDPYSINESYSPKAKNLSSKFPGMVTRPGFSIAGATFGTKVLGFAAWKNSELHAVFNDGTWRRLNGSTWETLKTGLDNTAEWSFCNFKGNLNGVNLIGSNGVDPVQRYNGTTVQPLLNAPSGLKYIDQHDNRLYGAIQNKVYYSGLNLADQWSLVGSPNDSSPGQIVRETNDGEDIVGLKSGAGHITVFFPSSSHELYGTSPSDFSFMVVADDIGALNDKCIASLGGVMYFLDKTGIYVYSGGTRPRKEFSKPVQWYVDNMYKAAPYACSIGSDGRYLYIAVPMNFSITANTILVYDSIEQTWDVWEGISPTYTVKVENLLYMSDSKGRVMQIVGTTDNGSPISWEWQSKTFSGQSMLQKIRWTRLWLVVDKPAGSTLGVYMTKEPEADSGWVQVGNLDSLVNIQGKAIYINPSAVGVANWLRLKIAGTGPCTIREVSWDEMLNSVT